MTRRLPTMAEIGRCLRLARENAKVTQSRAAAVCRNAADEPMQRSAIAAWEAGDSLPQVHNLLRLARLYRVSATQLLGEAQPRKEIEAGTERAKKIIELADEIWKLAMGQADPKAGGSEPPPAAESAEG